MRAVSARNRVGLARSIKFMAFLIVVTGASGNVVPKS
jgi:hypothetical protein